MLNILKERPFLWLLLLSAGVILSLNMGIRQTLGLFLPDMIIGTGWGAGTFALAFALQNLIWGLASPISGMIADRYGTLPTLIVGALLFSLGLFWMGDPSSPWGLHGSAGLLIGLGVGATTFPLVLGAIGRHFPLSIRASALGIASAGGSVGQFVMAPVTAELNSAFGYTQALTYIALLALVIVPFAFVLSERYLTDDAKNAPASSMKAALTNAAGDRNYLLLNAGFFVCGFHVAFIAVHLPAFAALCGLPNSAAATGLALIGLANIVGTLLSGRFSDRIPKKWVLSFIYGGRALVIAVFIAFPVTEVTMMIFSIAMGLLWLSTVPPTSGLVGEFFGPRYVASLFGVVMFSHQIGGFAGAWLGGVIFDMTGNYDWVWYISIALGIFAALVHMPIRPHEEPEVTQAAE